MGKLEAILLLLCDRMLEEIFGSFKETLIGFKSHYILKGKKLKAIEFFKKKIVDLAEDWLLL